MTFSSPGSDLDRAVSRTVYAPPERRTARAVPVLFAHYGEPWIRGSERVLLDLLARVDRTRFLPFVWCNTSVFADAVTALDLPVRVTPMRQLFGWDSPRFDVSTYRALVREGAALLHEHGAALVHANSGAPNQWLVPAARRAGVPLIAHLHAHYQLRDRVSLRLYEAPRIVGCSSWTVEPFLEDGVSAKRVRIIANGVDLERIARGDAYATRAELGLLPEDLVIAGVGSLLRGKGWDVLLRAVRVLESRGLPTTLLLVGEGSCRGELERTADELRIADRVHFLGERSDAGAILRDVTDIAVHPSRFESFGLAAAEAGAMGVPCVITDIPGLRDVVVHEQTGLHVPKDDPEALADAIARLMNDRMLRRRLGAAAAAHVRHHFTAERMVEDFHSLYDELLTSRDSHTLPPSQRLWPVVTGGRRMIRRQLFGASSRS